MPRRFRYLFCLMLTLGLVTAACGNSDDDDDTASDPTVPAETTTAAPDGGGGTTAPPTGETTTTGAGATDGGGADGGGFPTEFVAIEGVPGVTDDEIAYAIIATDANNPLGTCIRPCYTDGIEAYFRYVNEQGGIYGRQLVIGDNLDDELANNQVRSEEVIAGGEAFGVFGSTLVFSGAAALNDNGVPTYIFGIHATEQANREAIFGHFGQACADCTNRTVPWLAREAGASTVASLGYGISENSKVCAGAFRESVELYSDDVGGLTVGYFNDDIAFGLPNGIAPEVTAMLDAGVDFVATCMDLVGMQTLAQEFDRQGGQDVVLFHPNTYNIEFARAAGDIFAGDYILAPFRPFEAGAGNALLDAYFENMEALGSDLTEGSMIGWINADLAVRGLIEAGPEFDRQSVLDATNAITSYSAGGLIIPIDWTRQHTPPTEGDPTYDYVQECFAAVQFDGQDFIPVGGVDTPWLCWPNDTLEWSEPVPTNFE